MKICFLTAGQPSTQPRLVKEADVLTEAGHQVHAICAYFANWASEMDKDLLASRSWTCTYVGGDPSKHPLRYYWTRLRHGGSRRSLAAWGGSSIIKRWALCRVLPELEHAAKRQQADLYIVHNLGALPAAAAAAQKYNARLGFDAEDFHSGARVLGDGRFVPDTLAEYFEERYLSQCHYITAASPFIADAYAAKYGIPRPISILNVFPLSQRPQHFRSSKEGDPLTLYWFSQTIGANRGLEDILEAMGTLRECRIELYLQGNWQPGYRDELFHFTAAVNVKPEQIIVHAPASPDRMARIAAAYDIGLALESVVNENRNICLTNKLFTYLLAGNALIGTATRGQKPVIESLGSGGFCFEPGDVNALAQRLRFWHEDRRSLNEARRQSWEWGTRQYNWDLEKTKFLRVVDEVLGVSARQDSRAR